MAPVVWTWSPHFSSQLRKQSFPSSSGNNIIIRQVLYIQYLSVSSIKQDVACLQQKYHRTSCHLEKASLCFLHLKQKRALNWSYLMQLFQRHVVCTKFDIYVFIKYHATRQPDNNITIIHKTYVTFLSIAILK